MTDANRTPELLRAIVREAAYAPSAHNVQAARWGWRRQDSVIALLRDPARTLPVGDPTGRDDRVGLGAALEGFALAAGVHGLSVMNLAWGEDAVAAVGTRSAGQLEVAASFNLQEGAAADPLAAFAALRRTWRGRLVHNERAMAALALFRNDAEAADVRLLGRELGEEIAAWIDEATWAFERQPRYHHELWTWMRLDPRDPAYLRDGLTADALLLSEAERVVARVLMHPTPFRLLQRTGLGKALVSERAATRTAAGFVCYCPPATLDDHQVGRRLYRTWLAATRAGLVLAPMSAIVDHSPTREAIESRLSLDPGRRLVQVFRAGTVHGLPPRSPRLPVEELLVQL